MTTMPSWLSDTADAVTAATDSAKLQAQVDTLTEAQRDLSAHLTKLTALSSATAAGGGAWFAGHTAKPEVFDALNAAKKAPTQGALGTLNRTLNSFVSAATNKAMEDWRSFSSERLAVPDLLELASTLASVESVAPLAAALTGVLKQLVPVSNHLPTPEAFELLDEAENRWRALESALQPEGVRQFLSAVARRDGASLDMLTEDVRTWLAANRAEASFRIVAGSSTQI